MSSEGDDPTLPYAIAFDPERDLLRRYELMVSTQISTLNGIDDTAAYIARLVGILAGLVLSVTSLAVSSQQASLTTQTSVVFILIGASVASFFISLVYAVIAYLRSKFEYGPSPDLGEYMAEFEVDEQQYRDVSLRGYSGPIRRNRRVVVTNAKRLERCLAAFLGGLLLPFGAGVLVVAPLSLSLEIGISVCFVMGSGWLAW